MLKGLSTILYQFRSEAVRHGPMIDSNSIHYPLYPLTSHFQRMMRFSGTPNSSAISPYEVSDLLYQISHEDLTALKAKSELAENAIKEADNQSLPFRLYHLTVNPEYRYGNYSKKQLEEKTKFIQLSADYLKKLLKITNYINLPVGLASNAIFATGKLKLEMHEEINATFVPLLNAKIQHLHAQGIVETLWGLTASGQAGHEIVKKLVEELKKRQVVKFQRVITAATNHLEYVIDPEPVENKNAELLREVAGHVQNQEIKKDLESLAEAFSN